MHISLLKPVQVIKECFWFFVELIEKVLIPEGIYHETGDIVF